jgi:hypothetical protein
MKSEKNKSFLYGTVFMVFIALILYAIIIDPISDYIYLKKDFAYTITNKVSMGSSGKTGTDSKYTFYLNGKWYAGYTMLPLHRDGTKYFIKFYPENPNRNKATIVIADPEDIKNLPPGGYRKLPHE